MPDSAARAQRCSSINASRVPQPDVIGPDLTEVAGLSDSIRHDSPERD